MRVYPENARMTWQRGTNKEVRYLPQVISVTDVHVLHALLGALRNDDDDNGNENVISKYNFSFL